jgi:DnaJ-class molecular chaperone
MRDPYSILGVNRSANADEIKSAWRSKAKTIHPDQNQDDPDAGERFAEMGQAYEVLKDPERRKRYDRASALQQTFMQQRQAAREAEMRAKASRERAAKVMEELARASAKRAQAEVLQSQAQQQQQNGKARGDAPPEPAEDMVERIFGVSPDGQTADSGQKKTADEASTAQAARPSSKSDATGADATDEGPGSRPAPQTTGMGSGLLNTLLRRIRGETVTVLETAPDLLAEAVVTIEDLLNRGSVVVHSSDDRDVRVSLSAGMTEGHVVRLKGQGLKLPGMKQGDLVVTLKVAKHADFRVSGFDIHTILPISLEDAVLGAEPMLKTPEGEQTIAVPAWSGSDQAIRLEGMGLYNDAGGRGDLVAELRIVLLEKPDPKVTDLMRHMRHGLYL